MLSSASSNKTGEKERDREMRETQEMREYVTQGRKREGKKERKKEGKKRKKERKEKKEEGKGEDG